MRKIIKKIKMKKENIMVVLSGEVFMTVMDAKYFLSIVLEAVTMALAIIVCNAFLNAGLPTFTSDYADWTKALMYMCELTFSVAMTVGAVKGAQGLTSKALGL